VPARLGKLLVRVLQLLEQARILGGYDGLIGEGLQEGDLLVRERTYLIAKVALAQGTPLGTAPL
jgi:hypothetical protein